MPNTLRDASNFLVDTGDMQSRMRHFNWQSASRDEGWSSAGARAKSWRKGRIAKRAKLNYSLCTCARGRPRRKRVSFNFPAKVRSGVMPAFVEADAACALRYYSKVLKPISCGRYTARWVLCQRNSRWSVSRTLVVAHLLDFQLARFSDFITLYACASLSFSLSFLPLPFFPHVLHKCYYNLILR